MFDADTAAMMRTAPALSGVDPLLLPQELTRVYAELAARRLRGRGEETAGEIDVALARLRRIATVYEAAVDRGASGESRRAAAFVAATAYQLLARSAHPSSPHSGRVLFAGHVDPSVAAPLLFLIAEQSPDARESARILYRASGERDLLRQALVESVADLASERFVEVLDRAERLERLGPRSADELSEQATQSLYGMCWAGITLLVARLLGREARSGQFRVLDSPQLTFERVVSLATQSRDAIGELGFEIASYPGPRHLARLLSHVADSLAGRGIVRIPAPTGTDREKWNSWLRYRAKTKPLLWRNHADAVNSGFLEQGNSAVMVLPTGAGKTTLSELKIAATLAAGRKVIFLVPTLALVDQLRDDLKESFPAGEIGGAISTDGDLSTLGEGLQLQAIEVMTPERCLALFAFSRTDFSEAGLLVFDECHLLSPVGGGSRSVDAMLCLLHAIKRAPHADLLLLSAMISNTEEVAAWLTERTGRKCLAIAHTWKPSRQARGVVVYPRQALAAVEVALTSRRLAKQARRRAKRLPPGAAHARISSLPQVSVPRVPAFGLFGLHNNWNPSAKVDRALLPLTDDDVALGEGERGATPNVNVVASKLAVMSVKARMKAIVFVQQADHAVSVAKNASESLAAPALLNDHEQRLWDTVVREVGGEAHSLVRPMRGAQAHNADMLPEERRLVESMFRRPDGVGLLVATPTLAQGMNLPAEVVIIAGDKRFDEGERGDLKAHEILNTAGRAGRAGHLANGMVLLVPDPVIGFLANEQPDPAGFTKLRALLPSSDQCVEVEDPLARMLDELAVSTSSSADVRYFLGRLRAGEEGNDASDAGIEMMRGSLAAFRARSRGQSIELEGKLEMLRVALDDASDVSEHATAVAAQSGLSADAMSVLETRLRDTRGEWPQSVLEWSDWLVEAFRDAPTAFRELVASDWAPMTKALRGRKSDEMLSSDDFDVMKRALRYWLTGRPLNEIEIGLGAPRESVKQCARARDFVLKFVARKLYMVAGAVSTLAIAIEAEDAPFEAVPAVLGTLALAIRRGVDSPAKLALAQLRPELRSRVVLHERFALECADFPIDDQLDFVGVIRIVRAQLEFAT